MGSCWPPILLRPVWVVLSNGATMGTPMGALVGLGRGRPFAGAGQGFVRGGATGAGWAPGLCLVLVSADMLATGTQGSEQRSALVWVVLPAGLGSGTLLGRPEVRREPEEEQSEEPTPAKAATVA